MRNVWHDAYDVASSSRYRNTPKSVEKCRGKVYGVSYTLGNRAQTEYFHKDIKSKREKSPWHLKNMTVKEMSCIRMSYT